MKYEYLQSWLKRTKKRIVKIFGGKCEVCEYDKCLSALDFHHLDSSEKEFEISSWKYKKWETLVSELKKCVMVCCRCHREIHEGIIQAPENKERIWEYDKYGTLKVPKEERICVTCNKIFEVRFISSQRFCGKVCSSNRRKIIWPSLEHLSFMVDQHGYRKTGRMIGVTGNAIKKRLKKYSNVA